MTKMECLRYVVLEADEHRTYGRLTDAKARLDSIEDATSIEYCYARVDVHRLERRLTRLQDLLKRTTGPEDGGTYDWLLAKFEAARYEHNCTYRDVYRAVQRIHAAEELRFLHNVVHTVQVSIDSTKEEIDDALRVCRHLTRLRRLESRVTGECKLCEFSTVVSLAEWSK